MSSIGKHARLTDRRHRILKLMARGYKDEEIAHIMDLSISNEKMQKSRLYNFLGVHTAKDAIYVGLQQGLICSWDLQEQKGIKMKVKQENPISLSHSEIVFIKKLVKDEFKSSNLCNNLRLREKVLALCNKLNVLSFEQVVRKIKYYNIFELEISQDYLKHIENYSREKISISNCVRVMMLDFAQNASDVFCDFAYHTHYFTDEERQEEVKQYLEKINSDDETYRMFGTINSFMNLVNVKHDFEQIFNYVFPMRDEEYIFCCYKRYYRP